MILRDYQAHDIERLRHSSGHRAPIYAAHTGSYREIISQPRSEAELRAFADACGRKPGLGLHRLQEQNEDGAT